MEPMNTALKISEYACPEVLVSTDWLSDNLSTPKIRIIESNEDQLLYSSGHIPNALEIDWAKDLNDQLTRDYVQSDAFSSLMSRVGISNDSTVILYGDKNNWWACYTFWVFKLFGHEDVRILDGGRLKWINEGRVLTKEKPSFPKSNYVAKIRDDKTYRAFKDEVLLFTKNKGQLVDVRSPEEYRGERLHMEGYPNEGALRGGHIPTAKSMPWAKAVDPKTGCFLPAQELRALYIDQLGFDLGKPTIAYCRIGERSSHTWFVLHYLLGFKDVKNYDGSWTEWGNSVGMPIEK